MFSIEVRAVHCCDEKLGSVGVWAGVRHRELEQSYTQRIAQDTHQTASLVFQKEVLVVKLSPVNARAT